ncbi:glutathione S-transferase C-terminal domain-containing protein [Yoonia sp. GPGPB17]|uniref:glutathione S-transferase C-terminal domain-containing protein n=1 Tax=Yoonia sp. GPGPB17 TaxID=3026147 RepID=UPI0030C56DCC
MGMLLNGKWSSAVNRSMTEGRFVREDSSLHQLLAPSGNFGSDIRRDQLVLVASKSCPWSHATAIAHAINELDALIPIQVACGPRIEGYQVAVKGPLTNDYRHIHQLYTETDSAFTGRATVPLLWDWSEKKIICNDSTAILRFFDLIGSHSKLRPSSFLDEIDDLLAMIYDGLSNAVYRAGKAQRQDEYQEAVDLVFATMEELDERLRSQRFLVTRNLTEPDIRLFATLVRFDSVYATHFRCTRHRLVDFPNLWRYAREIYLMPSIRKTVDFGAIRSGYYLNDGHHNPFGIIAEQPVLDWSL